MKIGIIYCCYGNPEYIDDCLASWVKVKKSHDILIAAVHGQFKEYHDLGIEDKDEDAQIKLKDAEWNKQIDYLYLQNDYKIFWSDRYYDPIYQSEAEIRDKGLQWLLKQNCDIIWLLDNDERYTVEEINNIIEYLQYPENNYTWYSINFKNYIMDGKQWIDGFCPPRIFRVRLGGATLNKCYYDNDFEYLTNGNTSIQNIVISYKNLSNKQIPKNWAHIKHLTWLHSNGKQKVQYQLAHFGHCSYKWNEEKQELEIDYDFYRKIGQNPPIIYYD